MRRRWGALLLFVVALTAWSGGGAAAAGSPASIRWLATACAAPADERTVVFELEASTEGTTFEATVNGLPDSVASFPGGAVGRLDYTLRSEDAVLALVVIDRAHSAVTARAFVGGCAVDPAGGGSEPTPGSPETPGVDDRSSGPTGIGCPADAPSVGSGMPRLAPCETTAPAPSGEVVPSVSTSGGQDFFASGGMSVDRRESAVVDPPADRDAWAEAELGAARTGLAVTGADLVTVAAVGAILVIGGASLHAHAGRRSRSRRAEIGHQPEAR